MPAIDFTRPDPELILAGTIWGEARGGGELPMGDVASVILNRVKAGMATDVVAACFAPFQFSCWNHGDPNRARILLAAQVNIDPSWLAARAVAQKALAGLLTDRTIHADHYYATSIRPPSWTRPPAVHTVTLWRHSFWRLMPLRAAGAVYAAADVSGDDAQRG